jgi:hypothetical protein
MQMTSAGCRVTSLFLPALFVVETPLLSQSTKTHNEFLIDVNRPFVYLKFDHIRPGSPRSADESTSRRTTISFLCGNDFVHSHGITAVLKYRSKVSGRSV